MIHRISIAAGAIIKDSSSRYLLQKNKHHNKYNLVSGHYERHLDEFQIFNTMVREVQEELDGLRYLVDFKLLPINPIRFFWINHSPKNKVGEETLYIFQFYKVEILYKTIEFPERLFASEMDFINFCSLNPSNLWIPEKSLESLCSQEEQMEYILEIKEQPISIALPVKKYIDLALGNEDGSGNIENFLSKNLIATQTIQCSSLYTKQYQLKFFCILPHGTTMPDIKLEIHQLIEKVHNANGMIGASLLEVKSTEFYQKKYSYLKELRNLGIDMIAISKQQSIEHSDILEIIQDLGMFYLHPVYN